MIDESPPGTWRAALTPDGPPCAVCRQNVCDHSDLEYQGLMPAPATRPASGLANTQGEQGAASTRAALVPHALSQPLHVPTPSPEAQHDHVR